MCILAQASVAPSSPFNKNCRVVATCKAIRKKIKYNPKATIPSEITSDTLLENLRKHIAQMGYSQSGRNHSRGMCAENDRVSPLPKDREASSNGQTKMSRCLPLTPSERKNSRQIEGPKNPSAPSRPERRAQGGRRDGC